MADDPEVTSWSTVLFLPGNPQTSRQRAALLSLFVRVDGLNVFVCDPDGWTVGILVNKRISAPF